MKAVQDYNVPVPPLLSLCEDHRYHPHSNYHAHHDQFSILGTPFYLMKYVPGRVLKDPLLPNLEPYQRKVLTFKRIYQ